MAIECIPILGPQLMKNLFFLIFVFAIPNSVSAFATNIIIGSDYHFSEVNIVGKETQPRMTSIRVGAVLQKQIGVEFVYRAKSDKDNLFNSTIQLEESVSAYIRLLSRTYEDITMEIDLGYAATNLTVNGSVDNYSGTEKYSGFSYRIAAEEKFRSYPNISLRIAYESLFDDGDLHIRGYSLGLSYQF